ncbi:MAG: hypothetical protein ACJ77M_18435 [Thermoleophilaceae bacterium]
MSSTLHKHVSAPPRGDSCIACGRPFKDGEAAVRLTSGSFGHSACVTYRRRRRPS